MVPFSKPSVSFSTGNSLHFSPGEGRALEVPYYLGLRGWHMKRNHRERFANRNEQEEVQR
jgi:hypothetical protein